ncbi:hypothetical protein RB597_010361 [Gaeumannomyces tritici]
MPETTTSQDPVSIADGQPDAVEADEQTQEAKTAISSMPKSEDRPEDDQGSAEGTLNEGTLNESNNPHDAGDADVSPQGETVSGAVSAALLSPRPREVRWPLGQVPVEIFQLICGYLPRESVQVLRLVCSEFDHMVSAHYFRSVVAPFRASLYGSPDNHSGALVAGEFGPGGRAELRTVFHLFGEHIRSFALALELKETDLAFPPPKLTQEVVKTSWGLYRWPLKHYQRYTNLEAIEDQADETAFMTRSFSKLTELTELGLSCDAGLGFLQGPNLNKYAARTMPPVFHSARSMPSRPNDLSDNDPSDNDLPDENLSDEDRTLDHGKSVRYTNLKRMMLNAGFVPDEIPGAINLLLWCEGKDPKWVNRDDCDGDGDGTGLGYGSMSRTREFRPARNHSTDLSGAKKKGCRAHPLEPLQLTAAQKEMLLEMSWAHDALVQSYVISVTDNPHAFKNVTTVNMARIPASLLRTISRPSFWESLAAVDKFSLGVIPDWRVVKKDNGVIADYLLQPTDSVTPAYELLANCIAPRRQITKLHFEWICGGELGNGAGQRNRYILPAPFLAAALQMAEPRVVSRDRGLVLSLPFVRELSLKNCYFTPHVLLHVVRTLSARSLEKLKLEAVSITGPPQTDILPSYLALSGDRSSAWPWPLCCSTAAPGRAFLFAGVQAAAPLQAQNMLGIHAQWMAQNNMIPPALIQANGAQWLAQQVAGGPMTQPIIWPVNNVASIVHQPVGPAPPLPDEVWQGPLKSPWIPIPRLLSWAHILNEITPDQTLLERYEGSPIQDGDGEAFQNLAQKLKQFVPSPAAADKGRLQNIEFKSCGYVLADAPTINNHDIIPSTQRMVAMPTNMMETLRNLEGYMLRSNYPLLGKIMDDFDDAEEFIMRHAFDMYFGWKGVYSPEVAQAAHEDGFLEQGRGRFTGGWRRGKPLPEVQSLVAAATIGTDTTAPSTDGSVPDN